MDQKELLDEQPTPMTMMHHQQNDYEKFLNENNELFYKEGIFKSRQTIIPDDDIQIVDVEKRFETIDLSKPELEAEIDLHVSECLRSYNSNYLYLVKNYDKYSIQNLTSQKKVLLNREMASNEDEDGNDEDDDDDISRKSVNFENLKSDRINESIIEKKRIDVEYQQQHGGTTKRIKQLFNYYQDIQSECFEEEFNRTEFDAPNEFSSKTCTFLCKCTQLKFELDCEPIFAQMALYDLKNRKKISETFHFDLNSEHVKYMLRAHQQYNQQDASTLSQTCSFNVTYPNDDIFLVIRLEKVLQQGDIAECVEPYVKIQQLQNYNEKQNYKEKFHLNAIQFCERLGKYRMPFAWTAINLMNILNITTTDTSTTSTTCDYLNTFKPVSISINSFFKQDLERLSDQDLFKYLAELKKSQHSSSLIKKLKSINGILKIEFSPFNKHQPPQQHQSQFLNINNYYFINSSLQRLKYFSSRSSSTTNNNNSELQQNVYIIKDLLEFPSHEIFIPNYSYRNLLFIYPLEINFNNRQQNPSLSGQQQQQQQPSSGSSGGGLGGSARNIVIKIQLMKEENENYALPLLFSKSSTREFCKEIFSTVLYHNKTPQYYDELKLKLPAILTDANYHLLFTFSHVSCNLQKISGDETNSSSQIETIIGYSWLPLLQLIDRQRVINSGVYTLPIIFTDRLQNGYTQSQNSSIYSPNETELNEIYNLKSYFQLKLNLQSTVHTQDAHLDSFINISNNILMNDFIYLNNKELHQQRSENIESLLRQSLIELHLAQNEPLMKFLFILLDKLFNVMMIFNQNISQLCLSAINRICIKITNLLLNENDVYTRNKYLVQYIRYTCNLPYKTTSSASQHQRLFHEELTLQLIKMLKSPLDDEQILFNLWFFLELLFKSMSFYVLIINTAAHSTTDLNLKYHKKFTKFFIDNLIMLVKLVIIEILHKNLSANQKNFKLTLKINANLAYFLHDCFSILDRTLIFQLIQIYMKEVNLKLKKCQRSYDSRHLNALKLDFLRILCSHEHFIALNQPVDSQTNTKSLLSQCTYFFTQPPQQNPTKTSPSYFKRYVLFGVLLKNFNQIFNSKTSLKQPQFTLAQVKLINLLKSLFESHDFDDRFQNVRSKLASLYIPFLIIILNHISFIYEATRKQQILLDGNINLKNLLICVLWMFKNFDKNFLMIKLIKYFNYEKLNKLLQVLDLCLVYFEFKKIDRASGSVGGGGTLPLMDELNRKLNRLNFKLKLEDLIVGTQNARSEFIKRVSSQNQKKSDDENEDFVEENDDDVFDDDNNIVDDYSGDYDDDDEDLVIIDDDDDDNDQDDGIDDIEFDLYSTNSASSQLTNELQKQQSSSSSTTLRWRKDQFKYRNQSSNSSTTSMERVMGTSIGKKSIQTVNSSSSQPSNDEQKILSTECTLVILDTIDVLVKYIQQIQQKRISISSTTSSSSTTTLSIDSIIQANYLLLLTNIFKLILNSFSLNQSVNALKNLFSQQRILLSKYPELVFDNISSFLQKANSSHQQQQIINNYKNENSLCSDLCSCLLKYSISNNRTIRSEASASIYALLKQNYDICNNFTRAKISLTISFNSLINQMISNNSEIELAQNEYFLKKSLRTVYSYTDLDSDFTFQNVQIKDFVLNLNSIMSSMIRIKAMKFIDNEMHIDLMYRIAGCYTNTPNLRLIWLQNMAQKHLQLGNLVEAGHCLVHAAALIAEYLSIIENKPYLPIGCITFKHATVNVIEESAIYEDILLSAYNMDSPSSPLLTTDPAQLNNLQYSGKYFTENGLISLIEQAAVFLIHSQHYEVANQLYKIVIPIYESCRDYKKLAQIHSKLNDCFNKIMIHGSKRLFGTFFRVGFYGKLFEELDGEEFVYKEPGITKLSEIANKIESFYNEKFSPSVVEIMKDSNNVDRKVLLENKAYIQITYVEPYFDRWELLKCVTHFEKNYSLKRFIYSTPFTLDGKAHGTLKEQYKRKTILSTERAFPYIKTRIPVIDKQQVVLTPVEVAVEDIQKKIDELRQAIVQEPSDPKILQMVLQGCVGTTVNQGPLEMALAFLQPNSTELFTEHHNKLRICFKEFIRRCGDALDKNKTLIGSDQIEYQQEMERNHKDLKAKIEPLIEARPFTFA